MKGQTSVDSDQCRRGLLNGKSPGQPSKLNDVQHQAIARMIESGPIPAVHDVVRWRLINLAQWIFEEFRITIAKQTPDLIVSVPASNPASGVLYESAPYYNIPNKAPRERTFWYAYKHCEGRPNVP